MNNSHFEQTALFYTILIKLFLRVITLSLDNVLVGLSIPTKNPIGREKYCFERKNQEYTSRKRNPKELPKFSE